MFHNILPEAKYNVVRGDVHHARYKLPSMIRPSSQPWGLLMGPPTGQNTPPRKWSAVGVLKARAKKRNPQALSGRCRVERSSTPPSMDDARRLLGVAAHVAVVGDSASAAGVL